MTSFFIEFTGQPYQSEVLKPVEENQEPPEGWPRNPIFNAPGDVPGPPVQFGPPVVLIVLQRRLELLSVE